MGNLNEISLNEFMNLVGGKWTLDIIKNIYFGYDRFNDFLEQNPKLSNKVLSEKLKTLEENDLIKKEILSESPLITKYSLTKKSEDLNRILFFINEFSYKYFNLNCRTCEKTKKIFKEE